MIKILIIKKGLLKLILEDNTKNRVVITSLDLHRCKTFTDFAQLILEKEEEEKEFNPQEILQNIIDKK